MKNYFALKGLDLFKKIYTRYGVDYDVMRLIIQVKLTLDSRRMSNNNSNMYEEIKEKNYFFTSLIVYAILGVMSVPLLFMNMDIRLKMTMNFSCFMILLLTALISDFSSVILDIDDKDIIGIRGVDSKTLNAAKATHIFLYIFALSLALSAFSMIAFLRFGIKYFLLYILSIILIDILMIMITSIIYLVILKLFKGEKLKDILNTFQIAFLLLFTIGFQFIIRGFDYMNVDFTYTSSWWNILFIPMWFASNFKLIQGSGYDIVGIILSIMSVSVPIISLIIYGKFSLVFEKNLQKLNDNTYKNKSKKENLTFKISKLICKEKEERAIFNFTYNILSKDRDFKTKVYPSLALGTFMPIIMLISAYDNSGLGNYMNEIKDSYMFLSAYFIVVIMQNIITMTGYSNEYEGAWVYNVLPIKNKSNIYTGTFKSSIYKLGIPSFIILSIIFIGIFEIKVVKHLLIIFLSEIFVSMLTFKFNEKILPFSKPYNIGDSSKNIFVVFRCIFITGILLLIHFGIILMNNNMLIYIYLLALIIIVRMSWKVVFKINNKN